MTSLVHFYFLLVLVLMTSWTLEIVLEICCSSSNFDDFHFESKYLHQSLWSTHAQFLGTWNYLDWRYPIRTLHISLKSSLKFDNLWRRVRGDLRNSCLLKGVILILGVRITIVIENFSHICLKLRMQDAPHSIQDMWRWNYFKKMKMLLTTMNLLILLKFSNIKMMQYIVKL